MPNLYDDAQRISNSFSSSFMPFGYNTNEKARINKAQQLTRTLHDPMNDTKATGVFSKASVSPKQYFNHSQASIQQINEHLGSSAENIMKGSQILIPNQLNSQESAVSIENKPIMKKTKPQKDHDVESRPQLSMWDLMVLYDTNKKRLEDNEARNLVKQQHKDLRSFYDTQI